MMTMNARAIDIMHELEDTNTALQRTRAELAIARKVMDAVADQRDAARAEAAALREQVEWMRSVAQNALDRGSTNDLIDAWKYQRALEDIASEEQDDNSSHVAP